MENRAIEASLPLARLQIILALVAGSIQPKNWNPYGAIRTAFDRLAKKSFKMPWIAVWRQSHNFVFVGIEIEAKMVGDKRVKNS